MSVSRRRSFEPLHEEMSCEDDVEHALITEENLERLAAAPNDNITRAEVAMIF